MKRLTKFLTLFFVLFPSLAIATDWPQFRGPNRDGISSETGLLKKWPKGGPNLLWTFDKTGTGYSGPAIVGNKLYISGGRGEKEYLIAMELDPTGAQAPKELWSVPIGEIFTWRGNEWNMGPNASPTVDGDHVYALGGFGDLICVEAKSGKEIWRVSMPGDLGGEVNPIGGGLEKPTSLGWGYAWSPLIDGDKLICVPGGKKGLIAALDKKTGKILWQSKEITEQAPYSSTIATEIGGVRQYVQAVNSGLVGVSAAEGKLLWRYKREELYDDVVIASPIVRDGYAFASVGFGQGGDLVKITGGAKGFNVEKVVSNKNVQNRDGGLVLVDDYLYGHSEKGGWFCQEFKTGKQLWTESEKLGRGPIATANGFLYLQSEKGELVLLDASSKGWSENGRFKLPKNSALKRPSGAIWTHPVIANGKLFCRDQEFLYCFDIKDK